MTIDDLANDTSFDPDDYRHARGHSTDRVHCNVSGCTVRHVVRSDIDRGNIGVCGYCRAKVKALRVAIVAELAEVA